MSRQRPAEQPQTLPDQQRGKNRHIEARKARQARELEALKRFSGAMFFGGLFEKFSTGVRTIGPKFVRRGYEADIVENLNGFYAQRPRPWRPASRSACGSTHKERLQMRRRTANA